MSSHGERLARLLGGIPASELDSNNALEWNWRVGFSLLPPSSRTAHPKLQHFKLNEQALAAIEPFVIVPPAPPESYSGAARAETPSKSIPPHPANAPTSGPTNGPSSGSTNGSTSASAGVGRSPAKASSTSKPSSSAKGSGSVFLSRSTAAAPSAPAPFKKMKPADNAGRSKMKMLDEGEAATIRIGSLSKPPSKRAKAAAEAAAAAAAAAADDPFDGAIVADTSASGGATYFQDRNKRWAYRTNKEGHLLLKGMIEQASPLLRAAFRRAEASGGKEEGERIYAQKPNLSGAGITWSQQNYAHLGLQAEYLRLKSVQRFTEAFAAMQRVRNVGGLAAIRASAAAAAARAGAAAETPKTARAETARAETTGTKAAGAKEAGAKAAGAKEAGAKEAGAKEAGAQQVASAPKLRVASLGGGPGFELLAVRAFLERECPETALDLISLDLEESWRPCAEELGVRFSVWDVNDGEGLLAKVNDPHSTHLPPHGTLPIPPPCIHTRPPYSFPRPDGSG